MERKRQLISIPVLQSNVYACNRLIRHTLILYSFITYRELNLRHSDVATLFLLYVTLLSYFSTIHYCYRACSAFLCHQTFLYCKWFADVACLHLLDKYTHHHLEMLLESQFLAWLRLLEHAVFQVCLYYNLFTNKSTAIHLSIPLQQLIFTVQ